VSALATARPAAKKKTRHAAERDTPRVQPARLTYGEQLAAVHMQQLKCVNASGVNLALTCLYGRVPTGERAVGSVPRHYGANVTRLGALSLMGLHALMTVDGATDGEVFRAFVEQVLCPTRCAGDIVVRDNLRAHKVTGIREAMAGCGAQMVYLPPSSSDLTPLAPCWSQLKTRLRRVGARTQEALDAAMAQVLEQALLRMLWPGLHIVVIW
jgi:transposase